MDVCFLVYELDSLDGYVVVKGLWVNQGQVKPYAIYSDSFQIFNSDISNWSATGDSLPRSAKWDRLSVNL